MTKPGTISRHKLAETIAIDRALYEASVLARGYSEQAFEPLIPYAKSVVKRELRAGRRIAGCSYRRGDYGDTFTLNVDWQKLGAAVERQLPGWRSLAREEVAAGYDSFRVA